MTTYQTDDLGIAAYLLALGYPLTGLTGDQRRRTFTFDKVPTGVAEAYWAGATCPARAYYVALRDLKARLYHQ